MVAPVAFAPRRRQQAPEAVVGTGGKKSSTITSTVLWVLGLCTASTAITVAVCVPPPALHKSAYFLVISCFFFAGVAGVMSAVSMDTTCNGRKVMDVLLDRLASVVGAAFRTPTTSLGMVGLAAACTAITVAVRVPPQALHKNAYFLAISCFFFAGVAGIVFAVSMDTTIHLGRRRRHATGRKLMYVRRAQLASIVVAAFSTKTAVGVLGLAAASTAMNLQQSVFQPHQVLDESEYYYYHLAISGVFFAGVAGVMVAAVRVG